MSSLSDRKYQLLLHKIGYLKLELEEKKEKLDLHEKEFNENYTSETPTPTTTDDSAVNESENLNDVIDEKDSQGDTPDSDEESESSKESLDDVDKGDVLPDEIKRLWKAIAVKTHPDKTNNNPDTTRLYKDALSAYGERKYEVLIEIAAILSISIEQPSQQLIEVLEARALELESDLKKIKDSVLWTWAAADPEKKRSIEEALRSYRKHKKKKSKR